MNDVQPFSDIPERIAGLGRLAYNLWWSWHPPARDLFRALDLQAWRESGHNPVRMLASLPQDVLASVVDDDEFLRRYDAVMSRFDAETTDHSGWFAGEYGRPESPLAFFSAGCAY